MVGKTYKVIVAQSAAIKLRKIYKYYETNVSKEVARKIRDGLLTEARRLEKLPESNPLLRIKKNYSSSFSIY